MNTLSRPCSFLWVVPVCQGMVSELAVRDVVLSVVWTGTVPVASVELESAQALIRVSSRETS